ncbi:hypothetical protein [Halalkalicoccus salilacus]|uniref:hypothetical protein n=1 Tax=Halalkalicoccus salilacus TaxID=3117459 RepID=UPI00300F7A12
MSDAETEEPSAVEELAEHSETIGELLTDLKRAIVEDDDQTDLIELAEELWDVLDQTQDVLETIDFEEVPEAIDLEELEENVDVEDIPEGLLNEDENAIELSTVREAVNLRELWDAVDLMDLREEKQQLESEIDDVTGDEDDDEDGGLLGDEADGGLLSDDEDDGELLGDEDDEDDGGLLDTDNVIGTEGAHVQFDAEARQALLEDKIQTAAEKFRWVLLSTHDKLRKLYELNQQKLGQPGRQPDSLNPTAYSSLPPGPIPDSASTRRSTVPAQVKYSKVKNPKRIYGRRFTKATRDGENAGTEADEVDEKHEDIEKGGTGEEGETEQREQTEEAIEANENDE